MTSRVKIHGRCLCGKVHFEAEAPSADVVVCHCGMCQRWAWGPLHSLEVKGDSVKIEGEENISVYVSSEWGERVFCKTCGTGMIWRTRTGSYHSVNAGAVTDKSGLNFASEIFFDEKPAYYQFANPSHKMTGAEAMAALLGSSDKTE
ncbi:MAG: GFA family protein [Hyphomicrobium sp.]|nr:GFA family protein [Hyphomicrobium sp.]